MIDWSPLWLTFKLALLTSGVLLCVGAPLAWWITRLRGAWKIVFEAIISLPLVLPPTVLGLYYLLVFGQSSIVGAWLAEQWNVHLVFSFSGLVVGSVLYSLPFMVQPLQTGLESLHPQSLEEAKVMGASTVQILWYVIVPQMLRFILTGLVLSFAHTVGEFGVIMMIGGNIPGETRVASLAIYDEVQSLNYHAAHVYAAILLGLSFVLLMLVHGVNKRFLRSWHT